MQTIRKNPIFILIAVNILIGLFIFKDYGLSWDEPLFYEYAEALPYAYSPAEWFSGNFALENAFGSSATDHANRGPAYIILARPFVQALKAFGIDHASAWHFINFLTFQLGVYFVYRISKRYTNEYAAVSAAALFAWQPLFWGHAFINPKDPPFLVFFTGAVCFGLEMVDEIGIKPNKWKIILAAFMLGIASSIRVLGPLAGALAGLYALSKISRIFFTHWIKTFGVYVIAGIIFSFATWPYLWRDPIQTFVQVFGFMSDNPTRLTVLFHGDTYEAGAVPLRYLPFYLTATLTEPVWFLFAAGAAVGFIRSNWSKRFELGVLILWFAIPFSYVLLRRPAMYDGFRHFQFISVPVFIMSAFAFEMVFKYLKPVWSKSIVAAALVLAGLVPAIQLHPYQYAYYNAFMGGTSGVFREYETEFWLTCYREAVLEFNQIAPPNANLFVRREPYIAAYYADADVTIRDFRAEQNQMQSGDYYLVNSRSNEDLRILRDQPPYVEISRSGALFCAIKQVP